MSLPHFGLIKDAASPLCWLTGLGNTGKFLRKLENELALKLVCAFLKFDLVGLLLKGVV